MGPLDISVNGASSGEGFVIVSTPAQPLPSTLTLRTTDGSEGEVTLRPAVGSAGSLSLAPSAVHVSSKPVTVQVLAGAAGTAQNDAAIEVVEGESVVARLELTALAAPRVRFRGRFQCRLATFRDRYDEEWGTALSSFRMYAVPGGTPLEPTQIPIEPPLDRIIRFQDAVALRPLCTPIGVAVSSVEADFGATRVHFTTGDPLIGLPLRLGPQARFEEQDGEFAVPSLQPIADFRLEIGDMFAGATEPAVERKNAQATDPQPSQAPYADGAYPHDDIGPWTPKDFEYLDSTWEEHAITLIAQKHADLLENEPADPAAHMIWERRVAVHAASSGNLRRPLESIQRFKGTIDRELVFPPEPQGMLAYLRTFDGIPFYAEFFDFDTDCQTGTVTGMLGVPAPQLFVPEAARFTPAEARSAPAEVGSQPP